MNGSLTKLSSPEARPDSQSFWDVLRNSGCVFESTIKGTSMEPTIPDGAGVRIRPQPAETYQTGQIVACVSKGALFAHRIVYCGSVGRRRDVVVTLGDNLVLCDPPTRKGEILGAVTEFRTDGAWRLPGPERVRARALQVISDLHGLLIYMCLLVHYEFARRVAGTSLIVGSLFKRAVSMIGRE